ncbi:MAG TPA: threonine synthase [Candidatus Dormibacteraeota bacterium]|nr:threonine synthase [Candidatus Dormibacteraeota bacterium]
MITAATRLTCPKCAAAYDPNLVQNLCACGSPLLVEYDLERAAAVLTKALLRDRDATMWRYRELLPLRDPENAVMLGEAMTPVIPLTRLGGRCGLSRLAVKDEGTLPTGSFKARGAAVGISRARELGITTVAMPTNGNAGGAWSAYAARAGMEAVVVMPATAPTINRLECAMYGARLALVDGLISDAGKIVGAAVKEHGWFDASTLKEPYRIEGKKTMGLEIAEQYGWEPPEVILYPAGGGVGLIGIDKALRELAAMGWIGERMPRMVAVQAAGCAPIVRAFEEGRRESTFWENARTVAFGITVPKALGDFLVLDALYATGGTAVAVGDAEILDWQHRTAEADGVLLCPEGAATVAAAAKLRESGWIREGERVLAINTGSGLKYPDAPRCPEPPLLQPGDPLA